MQGQEIGYKRTSIKTGTGIGINAGQRETGIGLIYSVGLQDFIRSSIICNNMWWIY